jgi:hypothetical protein
MSLKVTLANGSVHLVPLACQTCGEPITKRLFMDVDFHQWHCEFHHSGEQDIQLEMYEVKGLDLVD